MQYAILQKDNSIRLVSISPKEAAKRSDLIQVPDSVRAGDIYNKDTDSYSAPEEVVPPAPEYEKLLEKEGLTKIKTGVMTAAERDKLLVAIALKLGVLR